MGWYYRDPLSFPATFTQGFREAAAMYPNPLLLGTANHRQKLNGLAADFRWFRWCIREKPGAHSALEHIENNFQIRTWKENIEGTWFLYLEIKPTRLSEILRLNPHIENFLLEAPQTR